MSPWVGRQGVGSREYDAITYSRVVRAAKESLVFRSGEGMSQEDFSRTVELAGVAPRTIRAVLSDADGVEFLLDIGEYGLRIAEFAEDGEGTTRVLFAKANTLAERAERRRQFAESKLPRRQGRLFG